MAFHVIPMEKKHLPAVAEIERACFSHPWTEAMLEEALCSVHTAFFVAESEAGAVLGHAGLHFVLAEGYMDNIAVAPAFRRQGAADALLEALCRFSASKLTFLTLEVRVSNGPAISLYRKHRFLPVGRRKDYYDAPTEDALLMTRTF